MSGQVSTPAVIYKSLAFKGYPKYRVGSDGSVWSRKHGDWRKMSPGNATGEYLNVGLCKKGRPKSYYVHRLVLEAFVGPCPEEMEACHNDGNRKNNCLANLRWDSRLGNHADRRIHGTLPQGEKNQGAKITADDVVQIRQEHAGGKMQVQLQKDWKLSRSQISKIVSGKSWPHIG